MKVFTVSDSTQLALLGDVALLLGGWLQVSVCSGIKVLELMPKAYFIWDELRGFCFEMLGEQTMTVM